MMNSGLRTKDIRMSYVDPEDIDISVDLLYQIDSIVKSAITQKATPGCQVLVAKDGNVFLNKSYGYHTYEQEKSVSNLDIYDLASITKIGATLPILMKMKEDKILSLDDSFSLYLDSIGNKDLVIRDVLAHQAGLTPWIPFYKRTLVKDSISGKMNLRDTLYSDKFSVKYPYKVADNIYLHMQYPDSIIQQIKESDLLEYKQYCYSDLGYYLFKEIISS